MIIRAHPVAVEVIAYSAEGMVHWTKVKSQRHEGSGLLTFAFRLLPLRGQRKGSIVLLFAAQINLNFCAITTFSFRRIIARNLIRRAAGLKDVQKGM